MSSKVRVSSQAAATITNFEVTRPRIDKLVRLVLKNLNIPGIAVGFVANRKTVFAEGYGVRDHSDPRSKVTARTLFGIGSGTKSFTTYVLSRLVDERQIAWNDPVTKYVPEFQLDRPQETDSITIRDLVTHATGLPAHDAVWMRASRDDSVSVDEILKRLPHLKTVCRARQYFTYNNLMFGVAGRVIEKVSGRGWRESVRDLIFGPLGMTRSYCSIEDAERQLDDEDFAKPHMYDEEAECLTTYPDWMVLPEAVEPSHSVISTAEDMAKWIELQLSGQISHDMHSPCMPIGKGLLQTFDDSSFAYALGWFIGNRNGRYFVSHGGQVNGFRSIIVLFPGERMGIAVLANLDSNEDDPPINWLAFRIVDILTGRASSNVLDEHWVSKLAKRANDVRYSFWLDDSAVLADRPIDRPEEYVGQFEEAGYGLLEVSASDSDGLFVSYNGIRYRLYRKRGADFFCARITTPRTYLRWNQYECSFERDSWGDVCACRINFQPSVPPIRFVKKLSRELWAPEYLKLFVGVYENKLAQSIRVASNDENGVLSLIALEAPTNRFLGELKPFKRDYFLVGSVGFDFAIDDESEPYVIMHLGETVSRLIKKDN